MPSSINPTGILNAAVWAQLNTHLPQTEEQRLDALACILAEWLAQYSEDPATTAIQLFAKTHQQIKQKAQSCRYRIEETDEFPKAIDEEPPPYSHG